MKDNVLVGFCLKKNIHKLLSDQYQKNFKQLQESNIKIRYFYKEDKNIQVPEDTIIGLKERNVSLQKYHSEQDIVFELGKKRGNIYLNSFEEQDIPMINSIKKRLGQKTTKDSQIFINKKLQRETLGNNAPSTSIQFLQLEEKEQKTNLPKNMDYPVIIKPTGGIQSAGVHKAKNDKELILGIKNCREALTLLKQKGLKNNNILIEEFINGDSFSIDYFVNENQEVSIYPHIELFFGIDYGVEDFSNTLRIVRESTENKIKTEEIKDFIEKTIKGCEIRNTFVHHEFKRTKKGKLKTLEINGRIGGYRLEMYQEAYGKNILLAPFIQDKTLPKIINNLAVFTLYPKERSIFKGYNKKVTEKIKTLHSLHRINFGTYDIGEAIGPTKDGYSKVGVIVLKEGDSKTFEKDVKYIEENYYNILKTTPL